MKTYKYNGNDEREVPSKIVPQGETKIVKPGDIFESDKEINNPDFELIQDSQEETQPIINN